MGDAFVAVDAGLLAGDEEAFVLFDGAFALAGEVHGIGVMAVAAFKRVVGLEAGPLVAGEFQALFQEFLARGNGAEDHTPDLLTCGHLPRDLVGPVMGDVAIGASCTHARTVIVMDRRLQLRQDVIAHFMAANAEDLGVGDFKRCIKGAPENDASDKSADGQETKAVVDAWAR